ncbi:MAG: FG-GAP repeat protein [Phycisphaerales bacterium]|jgi:hypothetical protein|nr:FG-GAP repeat protein [Phycisphaerales bacterium]
MRRTTFVPVVCTLASVVFAPMAWSQVRHEDRKLTGPDAAAFDRFGRSVSISGNIALVGAYTADDSGPESGAAYLFDATTGELLFTLLPDDGAADDQFGTSVAISDGLAIVGAPYDDDDVHGLDSGSAYVFDVATGQQLMKLTANDGQQADRFGTAVAISGTTAVIGVPDEDDNGISAGAAYVFDLTTGQQRFKLLARNGAAGDVFGGSVSIAGNIALIGSRFDDDQGDQSGSAYLFDVTTGVQLRKLHANDGDEAYSFGSSVAISGGYAVIGAFFGQGSGINSGSAYVFDVATGQQLRELLPDDGGPQQSFGSGVAISGETAIVSALFDADNGENAGAAYLFNVTTGAQLAKLLASDGAPLDSLNSVSISGDKAIAGAPGHDVSGESSGAAYLFLPPPCPGDWDGSGGPPNSSDFLAYLNAWAAHDPAADLVPPGGNGNFNSADFLAFLNLYAAGC